MAAQALGSRTSAAAVLAETVRDATRYKDKPNPNLRLLQLKVDKLLADKGELFKKHLMYGELSKKELNDEEMSSYITPLMDSASDIADELYIMIDNLETTASNQQKAADEVNIQAEKTNEMQVIELQCDADESALNETINDISAIYNDVNKTEKDDAILVQSYLDQIEELTQGFQKHWGVLKLHYRDDKLTAFITKQQQLKKTIADTTVKALCFIKKFNPEVAAQPKPGSTHGDASSVYSMHGDFHLKTEKVNNPHFSGDIRSFARFKSDFDDFVVPKYPNEKHQVYVLRHCFETCGKPHGH
jgi:hypothetical protein